MTHRAPLPPPATGDLPPWPIPQGAPDEGLAWPRITVVTPVLDHRRYIEDAMRSVLGQQYPNLEYIVIDGGSTDGTVEAIRAHAARLAYWVSEPDAGMYHALNKGLAHATGDILTWLNADDMFMPWTLWVVGEVFARHRERVEWLTGIPATWAVHGALRHVGALRSYSRRTLRRGLYDGRHLEFVQQEDTFWSRRLWERAGGRLDESLRLDADWDLWRRLARHAPLYTVQTVLAGFRVHPEQQVARHLDEYHREVDAARDGGLLPRLLGALPRPVWPLLRALARSEILTRRRPVVRSDAEGRWVLRP